MGLKIVIHATDDWSAVYVDGVLFRQSHDSDDSLAEILSKHFKKTPDTPLVIDSLEYSYHEIDLTGRFPTKLIDFHQYLLNLEKEKLETLHQETAELVETKTKELMKLEVQLARLNSNE